MKKGFTIIELLAVIVIIGVLSTIAVISINGVNKKFQKEYYDSQVELIILGGEDYFITNRDKLPLEIGDFSEVELKTLIDEKYIDPVYGYKKTECIDGKVTAVKIDDGEYEYSAYFTCEKYEYKTDSINPQIKITPESDTSSNSKIDINIKVSDSNLVSFDYKVIKDGIEKEKDKLLGLSEKNITLTEEGTYKVVVRAVDDTGNITEKTSARFIIDKTGPKDLSVILKLNSSSGQNYSSGSWTNKNVYKKYEATDISGIEKYQCSTTKTGTYTDCDKEEILKNEMDKTTYVRAVDKLGNIGSPIGFTVRIDKTGPELVTNPNTTWSNVGNTVNITATDKNGVSVKKWKEYNGSYDNISNDSFYTTVYTNYVYLEDSLGNKTEEKVYAYVDKQGPKVYFNIDDALEACAAYSYCPTIYCNSDNTECEATGSYMMCKDLIPLRFSDSSTIESGLSGNKNVEGKYTLLTTNTIQRDWFSITEEGFIFLMDFRSPGYVYLIELRVYDNAGNVSNIGKYKLTIPSRIYEGCFN